MASRRISFLLVAALGALLVHELAYATVETVSRTASGVDHDDLGMLASFVVTGGIAALIWAALRAERLPIGSFSWPALATLTALQTILFTGQEVTEAGMMGDPAAAFSRPAVLLGFLLQPIVAFLLLRTAAAGRRLVAFIEGAGAVRRERSAGPAQLLAPVRTAGFGETECPPPRLRGPPRPALT